MTWSDGGKYPPAELRKRIKPYLTGSKALPWKKALSLVAKAREALAEDEPDADIVPKLIAKLAKLEGAFPEIVRTSLEQAQAKNDTERAQKILQSPRAVLGGNND